MKFRFNLKYFLLFLLIFVIEVFIAFFVKDRIIRPYGGDVLAVILLYCLIKTFFDIKTIPLSLGVLFFTCIVELGQFFNLVNILNLQDNKIMRIVIGSSFSWGDIVAYILGALLCMLLDKDKTVVEK